MGVSVGTIAVAVPRGLGVKVGVVGTVLSCAAEAPAVEVGVGVEMMAGVFTAAGNMVDGCNAAPAEVEPQADMRHIKQK